LQRDEFKDTGQRRLADAGHGLRGKRGMVT
jgi:hypothetical protein